MKKMASAIPPIIAIDRRADRPLHGQIYDAYRTAIINRTLRPGQRVPSTRMLSQDLAVSRIPVLNAYAQLLAEGYFESRVGAGTVVSTSLPDQVVPAESRVAAHATRAHASRRPISKRLAPLQFDSDTAWRGWGAFGVSQVAFEHFPFPIWNKLVVRHARNVCATSLDYGSPMGAKKLRQAIADYLRTARGVRCDAEQIMIVSGSQQGVEVAARVLLDSGDPVWMEEPGYRFARSAFTFKGCQIVPVPVDHEGLNVAAGIKLCRKPKVAMVTPSHHYPLGVTMSASRRMQLLAWAEKVGSWIIEDDYDSEYRYESTPISSLQGMDNNERVIYLGTFSKVLFPSLRIGYLVIPPDLVDSFAAARVAMDIAPAGFHQGVLADFIEQGHFSRHLRRMRLVYAERRSVLKESIRKELGSAARVIGTESGMHLSVMIEGIHDREIAQLAAQENLWLVPLSSSYLSSSPRQGFILGFGSTPPEQIPAAVQKLRVLIEASQSSRDTNRAFKRAALAQN
jgi:GntR family transcriptional regulator/MocR family aminotransferase